jgi:hypothetical protein
LAKRQFRPPVGQFLALLQVSRQKQLGQGITPVAMGMPTAESGRQSEIMTVNFAQKPLKMPERITPQSQLPCNRT